MQPKTALDFQRGFDESSPAVPCTAGFDPAYAGGYRPGESALPEGYCVLTQDVWFPFY